MNYYLKLQIRFLLIVAILYFFNTLNIYFFPENIDFLKKSTLFFWIILSILIIDTRKEKICSFNNQFMVATTIFSIMVFLFSKNEKLYLGYIGDYKNFSNILFAINILMIGNSLFYFGTHMIRGGKITNEVEYKEKNSKIEKIIFYIYMILFVIFSLKEIKVLNYSYLERTLIQNENSGFLAILPKVLNVQFASLVLRNIFQKKMYKISIFAFILINILTLISGDRASILSFIIVAIYFYTREKNNFSFAKFLIRLIGISISIYLIFAMVQATRNNGVINYKWEYDTFDTYLLALDYYNNKPIESNSFFKIFINLIPRSIYAEKGILLGKILKLLSVGAPIQDYKLYGSTALNFQGEIYLNFRNYGLMIIFIFGILCKKIEDIVEKKIFYWDIIYSIIISYFYIIIRGDLVSQSTKLIVALIIFNLVYSIVHVVITVIKK